MRKELLELDAQIVAAASVVGKKEREGPLGEKFDLCDPDGRFGRKTWEGAESEMQRLAFNTVLAKAGMRDTDVGALFAGDLLNQCVGSAYGLLDFDVPYFGLYGACSTCAEGLLLASVMVSSDLLACCGSVTSSHYCSAERQYRMPIEYGSQRPPTAQWTATAAGAFLVRRSVRDHKTRAVIRRALPGKVIEKGVNDANNMGAAMAPAALDTLVRFFRHTGTRPSEYDRIYTGDLGYEGGRILCELMMLEGYEDFAAVYGDCGQMIYFKTEQDVHGGGSGCGCSAAVLAAEILPGLLRREGLHRILFLSTGAMMSPDSIKQGESIPAVAHLVELCRK